MVFGTPQSSLIHSPSAPAADHSLASSSGAPADGPGGLARRGGGGRLRRDVDALVVGRLAGDGQVVDHQAGGGIALVLADLEGVGAAAAEK